MPSKIKKLPGLEPIHYVDVINPAMLKKWFANKTTHYAWADAAEMATDDMKDVVQLQDIADKPASYKNVDPLLLARAIQHYVELVLGDWTENSADEKAKVLIDSLPLFVEMSKYLPHVNPADDYKSAYRGTSMDDVTLKKFIQSNSDESDWKKIQIGKESYLIYTGPKKKMFTYKPHRPVQSWTVDATVGAGFGNTLLGTPLDNSFFFDPAFMDQFGFQNEHETIHFGKEKMPVALMVEQEFYDKLVSNKKSTDDEEHQKFIDDYYDGNDLAYQIDRFMQLKKGDFNWWDKNKKKWAAREKEVGLTATYRYYIHLLNKLTSMPNLEESVVQESIEVSDEDGTLTLPL